MKQTMVLYPDAGVGHVGPMTQLANVFLKHGYNVTMVLVEPPFYALPPPIHPSPSMSYRPSFLQTLPPPASTLLMLQLLHYYNKQFEAFLHAIKRKSLHSVVLDMFCIDATDVCVKLGVLVDTFFAGSASCLSALTQLPALIVGRQTGLKELGDTPLDFVGVPPIPASHLINELLEHPEDEMCKAMINIWKHNTETMGVLLDTFESLESRAVQSFTGPLCVPERILPPIYCVGPLVGKGAKDDDKVERNECLEWLDVQLGRSVVFFCLGSKGALSKEQLKEIAVGLERSGYDDLGKYLKVGLEPDLGALLPQGFLERTKGRGLVINSWAPQMDVLGHRATGAFVTHCGWNSVLEAVVVGVPMLCLPLEAEQKMNTVCMTEDMGVAVELEGYMIGVIKADEVETKVQLVIEGEEGSQLRARLASLREEAEAALQEGGSSQAAFAQFQLDVDNIEK
ncbi:hypothetical protein VPH35_056835 [Triticum aestivum]